jgi:hypothetical protein
MSMRRIALVAFCSFLSSPALAGFEWVPAVETDRVPMTRADAVYDNSFNMAPPVLGGAPQGMIKGELVINPLSRFQRTSFPEQTRSPARAIRSAAR